MNPNEQKPGQQGGQQGGQGGQQGGGGQPSQVSRVKNPDRVASRAVSKSQGKADRVASAKVSTGSCDQFFPGLGRGFFWLGPREPFVVARRSPRPATLRMPLRIGCWRVHACRQPARWLGRSILGSSILGPLILGPLILDPLILGRSILASRRETDLASG
jgi:hypothetical protein